MPKVIRQLSNIVKIVGLKSFMDVLLLASQIFVVIARILCVAAALCVQLREKFGLASLSQVNLKALHSLLL